MATRSELTQLLDSELQSIISSEYGVSDPSSHVGPANHHDQQTLPSLQYETQVTPIKLGLNGESYVDEVVYNNGSAVSIIFRKDKTLFFDVIATAPNDNSKQRDELYEAVEDHFGKYDGKRNDAEDLHSDLDEIRVNSTSDESRPDDAVRGDRLSIEIDYKEYDEYTDFSSLESMSTDLVISDQEEPEEQTSDYNHDINYSSN